MTLREFSEMTIEVIREDGLANYLPTLAFPDTQEIRAIQGIPSEVDHRDAIQNVVRRSGHEKKEFFFGVRSGPQEIIVGHYQPGQPPQFMSIVERGQGYAASPVSSCEWWRIEQVI